MKIVINKNNFFKCDHIGFIILLFGYGITIYKWDGFLTFSQRNGKQWYKILLGYKIIVHKPLKKSSKKTN